MSEEAFRNFWFPDTVVIPSYWNLSSWGPTHHRTEKIHSHCNQFQFLIHSTCDHVCYFNLLNLECFVGSMWQLETLVSILWMSHNLLSQLWIRIWIVSSLWPLWKCFCEYYRVYCWTCVYIFIGYINRDRINRVFIYQIRRWN